MKNLDKLRLIQCDKCGKTVSDIGLIGNSQMYRDMFDKCCCPTCAFWDNIKLDGDVHSVDGRVYKVLPFQSEKPPGAVLGSHGKVHYFLTTGGQAFKSNDVWLIGTPPPYLSHEFPTTAYSITRKAYERLRDYGSPCCNRRCQDRFRCYFYDWKNDTGYPVSLNHTPGAQPCSIFLPIYWIRNYQSK